MQERQTDRKRYFNELAQTSERYFIPYIQQFKALEPGLRVLEIGCGDGGNLLPLSRMGCEVLGVDLSSTRIKTARQCFDEAGAKGEFIASDIFLITELRHQFNLIICHDVLEHIPDKALFMQNVRQYLAPNGIVFMSFPAWQMPFGGHQQICRSRWLSHLPWFHLLPRWAYKQILKWGHEGTDIIDELLSIKSTRCPIETFQRIAKRQGWQCKDRRFWLVNPHYEVKFHLRPRRLWPMFGALPWLRNFMTSSCFYILKA